MIRSLSLANFGPFADPTRLSFEVDAKTPDVQAFREGIKPRRVSTINALIGPNSAGKTNILKAVQFLLSFVAHSASRLEPKRSIPVTRFLLGSNGNKNTSFQLEFDSPDDSYLYRLRVNPAEVVGESLSVYSRKTKRYRALYRREGGRLAAPGNRTALRNLKHAIRPNTSLVSSGAQIGVGILTEIAEVLGRYYSNVGPAGYLPSTLVTMSGSDAYYAGERYATDERLRNFAQGSFRMWDLGIDEFFVERISVMGSDTFHAEGVHELPDGTRVLLPFEIEAAGTLKLYSLLPRIYDLLNNGGLAIMDEFEAALHPMLATRIVGLFEDPDTNPAGAQLLFSTHDITVLSHLMKEQVTLVERAELGSTCYRISEIKNVRRTDNLMSKYRAGAYGAIPIFS